MDARRSVRAEDISPRTREPPNVLKLTGARLMPRTDLDAIDQNCSEAAARVRCSAVLGDADSQAMTVST